MIKNLSLICAFGLVLLWSNSCKQPSPKVSATVTDTTNSTTALNQPDESTIHHFLHNLIDRSGIVYDTTVVEAFQARTWDKENGTSFDEPYALEIASKKYLLKNIQVQFGDEHLKETIYEVDTAMLFNFGGKKYYHITAGYYMCNGSGCGYVMHFLLDVQRQRLHLFQYFRGLGGIDDIIGDMNNDGKLDILVQQHLYTPEQPDSTDKHTSAFIPYTLNDKGYFEPIKNHNGAESFIIATYNDQWQMNNFKIIGGNNLDICKDCY